MGLPSLRFGCEFRAFPTLSIAGSKTSKQLVAFALTTGAIIVEKSTSVNGLLLNSKQRISRQGADISTRLTFDRPPCVRYD